MASRHQRPASLYATMMAAKFVRTLNAATRPTNREVLLEVILAATLMEANNGSLRFPRTQFDQADVAVAAGRRLEFAFDEVTHEYVVTLTPPEATEPEQTRLT